MKYSFRLMGRTTIFRTIKIYRYLGIKCFYGENLDLPGTTNARLKDIYLTIPNRQRLAL